VKRRIFESLIYRYQQNKATKAERMLVDRWYETLDREEIPERVIDEVQLWTKIQQQIENTTPQKSSIRKMVYWIGSVAATLLFCLGILFWENQTALDTVKQEVNVKPGYRIFETGVAQRKKVLLADGSTIILNARSKVKLDTVSYDRKDRVVELLAGEAFFEVKKDSTKAFIVNTQQVQTKVLGTSFTVKNYRESDEISVSVFTGKVQVAADNKSLGTLERGGQIRYTKNNHSIKQETFDLTIRNMYNVDLKAGDDQIARQRYSMPISKQLSWSATLESIKAVHHNKSRKEGSTVHIY